MKHLTPEDLAEELGIAVQTIYKRRSDGEPMPKAFKVGNRLRWRREVVDQWIADQERLAA